MEKKLLSLMVCLLMSCGIFATGIDREQAAKLARKFMAENFSQSSKARRAAATIPLNTVETGQSLVYAFNVEGGGYVVVAGDDCAPAVLGYSERSAIDAADMPEGMKALFEQYQQEMQYMIQNGLRASAIANLGDKVDHLMSCKWGQSAPYYYMCPRYKDNETKKLVRSLVGCTATAMAQILYYHKHPAEITSIPGEYYNPRMKKKVFYPGDDKKLDWDNMLPTYGTRFDVGGTQEQRNAVAWLMRLVGQSLTMQYSPNSSGAYPSSAYTSFVNFFNYDAESIKFISRAEYSYTDWCKLIYNEVAVEKRPVLYSGYSSTGGHTFVVDGYEKEDYFLINWGWYGDEDGAFRLLLCDAKKKYEGGGTGAQGYSCRQEAVIGIKPATTPQHIDPRPQTKFYWIRNEQLTRKSASEDFDLSRYVNRWIWNRVHVSEPYSLGYVVKKEDGTEMKRQLPMSEKSTNFTLKIGKQKWFNSEPLTFGANYADGTYYLEFMYRIGEAGEWHLCKPGFKVMCKITGNTLTFDARPDWLEANMQAIKLEGGKEDNYQIRLNLKNNSTDKTFERTLELALDNDGRNAQKVRIAVLLEPGEERVYNLFYKPNDYTPRTLYMASYEDGAPLCKTTVNTSKISSTFDIKGSFNLTDDLKQKADNSYVLKTDDESYTVVYKFKNTGSGDLVDYLALVDSIRDASDDTYEKNVLKGEMLTLKPGESYELKLTIDNDFDPDIVHKVSLISYDDYDCPYVNDKTSEFTIRPNSDLKFENFDVTPKEKADDEYAEYIVKGNQLTVSGKISNPEEKAFEGAIMISRYTIDLSENPETDEDGNNVIDCDQVYLDDISIPANGTVDYSKAFDLEGLVKNKDYSVFVEFEISFMPKLSGYPIPLYYSDAYLLNDGTPTGISITRVERQQQAEGVYDLQGRRINGKPSKGVYIINGKKYILK